jgi:hypothetical protein
MSDSEQRPPTGPRNAAAALRPAAVPWGRGGPAAGERRAGGAPAAPERPTSQTWP